MGSKLVGEVRLDGILVFFHCGSNTGYAIESLEKVFFRMSKRLFADETNIHFAYNNLDRGRPKTLPGNIENIISFDSTDHSKKAQHFIYDYIKRKKIDVAFGFDQPLSRPIYRTMKKAGIQHLISYWGAPISSINPLWKLKIKQLEVFFIRNKPTHFIFESQAMADTAIYGRGISSKDVSIIYLGVDTKRFQPLATDNYYTHNKFNIPENRKILFYSGHMEERKGVHIIVKAAVELALNRKRDDFHVLLLGNKNNQEEKFSKLYKNTEAEKYITFGGYQYDIDKILPSCHLGIIASTGWDSFTMSSIEMASCGLPLLASNLQGLSEAVEDGVTGFLFNPGNIIELVEKVEILLDNIDLVTKMSIAARKRVLELFTVERQIEQLTKVIKRITSTKR